MLKVETKVQNRLKSWSSQSCALRMEPERQDQTLSTSQVEESVQMIKNELVPCLESSMDRLQKIWNEIGLTEDQKEDRTQVVLQHLQHLLLEMVNEEDELRKTLVTNVETFSQEVAKLAEELGLPVCQDEAPTLLRQENELRTRVDEMKLVKHDRLKKMKTFRDDEKKWCDRLCLPPHNLGPVVVPTHEQLRELEANIEYLRNETAKRLETFEKLVVSVRERWISLEIDAKTSLERQLSEFDVMDTFVLSSENVDTVKQLNEELARQQRENISTAKELREELKSLWEKLEVDPEERTAFLTEQSGSTPTDIFRLREESERMKALKLQHIQKFIEGLRKELNTLWEKCFYGPPQRLEFAAASDDDFTEELLAAHEQEVERMKSYYEEHKHMFKMVEKRQTMFKRMREFELKEKDVNRFANRGGALLKEEKIRKTLMKELPKTEKELKADVEKWEVEYGRHFIIDGCRYLDDIDEQWAALKIEKEHQKEERHKRQKEIMNEEMVFGSKPTTPAKRRFIGTPARTPTKQRKMDGTSTPVKSMHSSVCPSPRRPVQGRPPISVPTKITKTWKAKTPKRISARLASKRQVLKDHNPNTSRSKMNGSLFPISGSKMANNKDVSLISCTSYNDFATGLDNDGKKANLRSSLVNNDRIHSMVSFV